MRLGAGRERARVSPGSASLKTPDCRNGDPPAGGVRLGTGAGRGCLSLSTSLGGLGLLVFLQEGPSLSLGWDGMRERESPPFPVLAAAPAFLDPPILMENSSVPSGTDAHSGQKPLLPPKDPAVMKRSALFTDRKPAPRNGARTGQVL
jgi:hypothetical protein